MDKFDPDFLESISSEIKDALNSLSPQKREEMEKAVYSASKVGAEMIPGCLRQVIECCGKEEVRSPELIMLVIAAVALGMNSFIDGYWLASGQSEQQVKDNRKSPGADGIQALWRGKGQELYEQFNKAVAEQLKGLGAGESGDAGAESPVACESGCQCMACSSYEIDADAPGGYDTISQLLWNNDLADNK